MDREIVACAERLAAVVADWADLVGAYVHGSAALGGFVSGRSDVDLLFVIGHDVGGALELGDRLIAASSPCPGRGVELSVVTSAQARACAPPWPFVVHVCTDGDPRVVDGRSSDGDPDLLMHYAVAHVAGEAIAGPPPAEVFGGPVRDAVLASLADELASAVNGESEAYAVLNACRAWQYLETGELVSKVSGASWAKERGGPLMIIGRALSAQMGLLADRAVTTDSECYVRSVIDQLAG